MVPIVSEGARLWEHMRKGWPVQPYEERPLRFTVLAEALDLVNNLYALKNAKNSKGEHIMDMSKLTELQKDIMRWIENDVTTDGLGNYGRPNHN